MDVDKRKQELFGNYSEKALQRFKKFHQANPAIYAEFLKRAKQMQATGRRRYSAMMIIQVVRWHQDLNTTGEVFKINNDYAPLYARLAVYNHPELEGFFEMRENSGRGTKSNEQRERENVYSLFQAELR